MKKLLFILVFLLLTSSLAEAKFAEDLQERCVNIVNYKLAGDVDTLLTYYFPEALDDPHAVKYFKKKQAKDARKNIKKGSVENVTVIETIEQSVTASEKTDFNIIEKLIVLTNVKFSEQKQPVVFQCEFGLEKKSSNWFMMNAI